MPEVHSAPYGGWHSPLSAAQLASAGLAFGQIEIDGADIYWVEGRPDEAGRAVVVRYTADEQVLDCTPPPLNARTRVHEYGGGALTVDRGVVYCSNFADQRLYRVEPGDVPRPFTPNANRRYAEGLVDQRRGRLICVCEDHSGDGEAVNTLLAIDLAQPDHSQVLVAGHDFFASPRLSPDGTLLAWLAWDHPNMPWDGTELWVGQVADDGSIFNPRLVAGGPDESIFQPEWSPGGVLHFASDRSNWWNLYRWRGGAIEPLCPLEAEIGQPQWIFAMSCYGFAAEDEIICVVRQDGSSRLARLDTTSGTLNWIATPYVSLDFLRVGAGFAAFVGGLPDQPPHVVRLDLASGQDVVLRRGSASSFAPEYMARPEPIAFPTEGGLTAHAFYYPPTNSAYAAPAGELPPLIVCCHGGPTGAASAAFKPGAACIQYWTSRGFAIVDVNYGGSTGYGRDYRQRLNGNWGVVDLDDCINAARFLVGRGLVDANRVAIHGGSAGGYTTLAVLTLRDYFKAGASYFGISDAEIFAKETHKFESRYCDRLFGPYPEQREVYVARSPIHFIDRLNCPLILFQGLEDKIVPPNQSEMMYAAVRAKGLPVAYIAYEGEQHGFRKAENIIRTLEAELYFFGKVFGFTPADDIPPVAIDNL